MKVLWLLRYVPLPPRTSGDAVYSRNLVKYISQASDMDVVSFATKDVQLSDMPDVKWHIVDAPTRGRASSLLSPAVPSIAYRHQVKAYVARVIELAETADVVVADHIGLLWVIPLLRAHFACRRAPVLIAVNHDHEGSLRMGMSSPIRNPVMAAVTRWDAYKAMKLERRAVRAADGLTAITEADQRAFAADAPHTRSLLLMPGYTGGQRSSRIIDASVPPRVAILGGRVSFHKQVVLKIILEEIDRNFPTGVIIDVVGEDNAFTRSLRQRFPRINFLGYIADIESYLDSVRIGLIPDEVGGGFKLRALTHVFMRTPMLALRKALDGMTLRDNIDFIGADSVQELVGRIAVDIDDFDRLNAVQEAAFDRYCDRFQWEERRASFLAFCETLKADNSRRR